MITSLLSPEVLRREEMVRSPGLVGASVEVPANDIGASEYLGVTEVRS